MSPSEVTNYVQLHGVEAARLKLRELLSQAVSALRSVQGGDIQLLAGITELIWKHSWRTGEEHHGHDA